MKLCQRILLDANEHILTGLWALGTEMPGPLDGFERLCSPCDLSFHPFILEAWGHGSKLWAEALPPTLKIRWSLNLVDDDQHKALLSDLSSNRCLLLISETLLGVQEACEGAGIGLVQIMPEPAHNLLVLHLANKSNTSLGTLLGGALILKTAIDSLLFVRGLSIKASALKLYPEQGDFNHELVKNLTAILG